LELTKQGYVTTSPLVVEARIRCFDSHFTINNP